MRKTRYLTCFFDYFYYRCYRLYEDKWNDESPMTYAVCITSTLQGFNFICIVLFLMYMCKFKVNFNPLFGGGIMFVFLFFNYIRYNNEVDIIKLSAKWSKDPMQRKRRNGFLLIIYAVVSTVSMVLIADYLGSINRAL